MLRHLPHFPSQACTSLLAGGRVSRQEASTALVTWGKQRVKAGPNSQPHPPPWSSAFLELAHHTAALTPPAPESSVGGVFIPDL